MDKLFPENKSLQEDHNCTGYCQLWTYQETESNKGIDLTEEQFEMAKGLLHLFATPLILKSNDYSANNTSLAIGPYNLAQYLMNNSVVVLNELESPESIKKRTNQDITFILPNKIISITASKPESILNTAKLLHLPLDDVILKETNSFNKTYEDRPSIKYS